ncbi:hypothetical protein [Streptomyces sp. NPDC005336]|uniref:hypothetical protein n=1 Tax=unclassified Streptomyces TaxID=2593676 RepID=UPI00339E646A
MSAAVRTDEEAAAHRQQPHRDAAHRQQGVVVDHLLIRVVVGRPAQLVVARDSFGPREVLPERRQEHRRAARRLSQLSVR